MPANRDDFNIAFRSALLQRGAAQKFSLFFLIILAIIIFFFDVYGFYFMKPIRTIINDGIYRVSMIASSPTRFLPNTMDGVSSLFNIKNENERLKKELEIYRLKELNVEYLTNQNINLKKILETNESFEGNTIISKVLIDKKSPYLKSIIINRGSRSGILKGMPVLDEKYLVGIVVEANYFSARVLLLNDLNSRIPVTFGNDGVQAILKGNGSLNPSLEYLPEDYTVEEGQKIFTSGKDRIFFPGTPVGTTTEDGEVELFSDSNQLSFVKIDISKHYKEAF